MEYKQENLIERVNEECSKIVQPILEESKRSLNVENLLTKTPFDYKHFQVWQQGIFELYMNNMLGDMLRITTPEGLSIYPEKLLKNLVGNGVYSKGNIRWTQSNITYHSTEIGKEYQEYHDLERESCRGGLKKSSLKRQEELHKKIFGSIECGTNLGSLFISPKIEPEKIKKILNCFLNPQVISLVPKKKDRIYDYFRAQTCPSVTDFLKEEPKISWESI